MGKIKVAIVGIGNCASSLVQGIEFYKSIDEQSGFIPGIMHNKIGDYTVGDIEFVAAFDINKKKVGKKLSEAIFTEPNCAKKFTDVLSGNVKVQKGPVLDGLGGKLENIIPIDSNQKEVNVAEILKIANAEILINFLPTGSFIATKFYAEQAILANCGFINAIPEPIASNHQWAEKFSRVNLPLAGDDIKSQIGATILHRTLIDLFNKRGGKIVKTTQINSGGNTDFLNLMEKPLRSHTKDFTKKNAIRSLIPYDDASIEVEINYKEGMGDTKECLIKTEGVIFGSTPILIEARLLVDDSPNSAGVMVDVIRGMKIAIDNKEGGPLSDLCGYYFKSPPIPYNDDIAHEKIIKMFTSDVII